jgi:hypothetical protein
VNETKDLAILSWRARIFKLLRSPEIDSKELIRPAYVALTQIFKLLRRPGIDSKDVYGTPGIDSKE